MAGAPAPIPVSCEKEEADTMILSIADLEAAGSAKMGKTARGMYVYIGDCFVATCPWNRLAFDIEKGVSNNARLAYVGNPIIISAVLVS